MVCGKLYGTVTRRIERLSGMFQQAGVAVEVPADIHTELLEEGLVDYALGRYGCSDTSVCRADPSGARDEGDAG